MVILVAKLEDLHPRYNLNLTRAHTLSVLGVLLLLYYIHQLLTQQPLLEHAQLYWLH